MRAVRMPMGARLLKLLRGAALSGLLSCSIPALAQQIYPTPEAGADALVAAIRNRDEAAMRRVLGAQWHTFIPRQDPEDIETFLAAWDQTHQLQYPEPGLALIAVGSEHWTLPVPLKNRGGGWQFDAKAGAEEMKTRRIGRNELAAMQAALAYWDAQHEYAQVDRDGDATLQYAQKFASTPGRHDGLYWETASDDETQSPLGPLFATHKPGEAYHGYRYRILTAQGSAAPGGAYDYIIQGRMVSGFALIAWPLRYGDTGVMSFMISHEGTLYEKDLGPESAAIAQQMQVFDPDASWREAYPRPITAAPATHETP